VTSVVAVAMCWSVNFWNCTLQAGRSKRADCERAINRPPCNQPAYLTIRVPCIYRLDGLTRRTSRDFNKRNRWGLSKRPAAGEDCGAAGEVKSTRGHTERRLETAGAAAATVTFAETTSHRSSNGTLSPFGSHTKESSTSSGIGTTMTSSRDENAGEKTVRTGTIVKAGSRLHDENRRDPPRRRFLTSRILARFRFSRRRLAADNNTAQLLRGRPSSRKKGNKISIKREPPNGAVSARRGLLMKAASAGAGARGGVGRRRWPLN